MKAAWVKQAEENAEEAKKKRRRSRLLRGLGLGAGVAGLGGLAYYYLKKHPELTWKSRSDASKPGNLPLPADDMVVSTPEPHAADAERYASNNPVIIKEVIRRLCHSEDGKAVSNMYRWFNRYEPHAAGYSYNDHERAIDYEGLHTPRYNMDPANPLNVDYDLSRTDYNPFKEDGIKAIQAREAAELESFKKKYSRQFQ